MTADNQAYEYKSFTVNAVTDYDVKAQQSTLFSTVPTAGYVKITTSDAITIKLDKTTNPAISQSSSEILEFGTHFIPIRSISNIYITSIGAATVGIFVSSGFNGMMAI